MLDRDREGFSQPSLQKSQAMSQTHVGIDVSKHQFDVALWGRPEEDDRLANDPQAIEALCRHLARLAPDRIVVEATGGLERSLALALALALQAAGLPVAGRDKTGLWVAGETLWLHVICDDTLTCSRPGARGDIWTEHVGTAVHDRFASYWSQLPEETRYAVCNAHLLRNLEEIVELEKVPDGWAACMQQWLLETRDLADHWYKTTGGPVPEPVRQAMATAWDTLLAPVLDHYESLPPPARGRRGHNLARSLWQLRDACLLFLADPAVPFTNNGAEQALRMVKLQMKISGCFRTRAGAERFAHMRGLVETARKQKRNLLELLRQSSDAPVPQPNPVPP